LIVSLVKTKDEHKVFTVHALTKLAAEGNRTFKLKRHSSLP